MPWIAKSGKSYQLCLLDTNAISDILKNKNSEGKHFVERFPPTDYTPCFSFYNLIELRRSKDVYRKFLSFFSIYPIFLLKIQSMIFIEEILKYDNDQDISILLNSFSPTGKDDSYNLKSFIDNLFRNLELKELESSWRDFEHNTLDSWISNKKNFIPKSNIPNSTDAEEYIEQSGLQTLMRLDMDWCKNKIENKEVLDINKFASVKMQLYSLYYRLYDPSWKPAPGEVTDLLIISAVPYVDVYITEKFQANIISKINKKVYNLNNVEIKRIRDLL